MSLSSLGAFHPQIVHTPIALLVFSALFALIARLYDREWLRKTSVLLLVLGFVGAFAAERSGIPAHRVPEHEQGVPEQAIDEHALAAQWVLRVSGLALIAVFAASRLQGRAAAVAGGLGLILQLMAAVAVARTGYLGGKLVYEHGANVRVDGVLVKSAHAEAEHEDEDRGRR